MLSLHLLPEFSLMINRKHLSLLKLMIMQMNSSIIQNNNHKSSYPSRSYSMLHNNKHKYNSRHNLIFNNLLSKKDCLHKEGDLPRKHLRIHKNNNLYLENNKINLKHKTPNLSKLKKLNNPLQRNNYHYRAIMYRSRV